MKGKQRKWLAGMIILAGCLLQLVGVRSVIAEAVEGGTLDPLEIPKYVIPLVIPPVMSDAGTAAGGSETADEYEIAVREFKQQILPGGIWNTINGRNDGPTAAADGFATDEDTSFTTGNALANDTDPDGDPLTVGAKP